MSSLGKIILFSLLAKLVISAAIPLTADEAYYWVWSQHMQLSYYDHPPFVAWLYALGDFFKFAPGSVRWPGVILAQATLVIWLRILRRFLTDDQRKMWLWLALLSPLVGGSAIVVTPDLPLMFFYALSLWFYFRWERDPRWWVSLLFGSAIGLGISSKYMMVLFAISLLPIVLWGRASRRQLLKSLPWLVLGGLVGSLPVWMWNYLHDFASIKFQTAHGLGKKQWKPSWTIEYFFAQIGLIFPIVLYWALRAKRQLPLAFHFLAWTPLLFFFFTTSRGYVEANWPIVAYPCIFALAVSSFPRNAKGLRFTAGFWGFAMAALLVIILGQPTWSHDHKFREFHRFDAIAEKGRDLQPLYARSYQMAAKMTFDMGRPIYKLRGMNRKDFFDYLDQSEPKEKVYYWAAEKTDKLPVQYKGAGHVETEVIPVDDVYEIRRIEVK